MSRSRLASIALTALAIVACTDDPAPVKPVGDAALPPVPGDAAITKPADAGPPDGAALYASRCALCHGDTGQGYVADNADALANPAFLAAASDEFLRRSIERGRPGTSMSAWGAAVGGPLSAAELEAVVQHVRGFASVSKVDVDSVTVSGSAARAQSYYDVKCKMCHGEQGRGGQYMSIANPEFLALASDGYLRLAIREGRSATPMPAFTGMLADQIIDDLVKLIRSWQKDPTATVADMPEWPAQLLAHPDGPEPAFGDDRLVSVDAVHSAIDGGARLLLADARTPTDYVADHITGAVSVPFYDADKYVDKLPKDVTIVAYCGCPHAASGALADNLSKRGFTHMKVLDEGYFVWHDRGYPVRTGPAP